MSIQQRRAGYRGRSTGFDGYELILRTSFSDVAPCSQRRSRLLLITRSVAPGSLARNVRHSSSIFSDCRRDGEKMQTSHDGTQKAYAATNIPVAQVLPNPVKNPQSNQQA